jgi:hypothetical protein
MVIPAKIPWAAAARSARFGSARLVLVALGLCALGPLACKKAPERPSADGGSDDAGPADADDDAPAPPQILDFTVSGCAAFDGASDGGLPHCLGPAPLTLSFAPITAGSVTRVLWDFGEGPSTSELYPTHTYAVPYKYTVTLLAPDIQARKMDFIVVTANPLGGPCDVDPQCDNGLTCLCGQAATQCPAAFSRGICAVSCATAACPDGAICADLGLGLDAATSRPVWRASHCLRGCSADADCAPGQLCRMVPVAGANPPRWDRACFFAFPGDPGSACRGPEGTPQDDLCLGGRCADFGAQGLCTADCSATPCPTGSACATFNDGRKLCLRRCGPASACGADPLIGCGGPGATGPWGYTLPADEPATGTFCGPKRCMADSACGPAGTCMGAPTGHCTRVAPTP